MLILLENTITKGKDQIMSYSKEEIILKSSDWNFLLSNLIHNQLLTKIKSVLDVGCGDDNEIFKLLGIEYTGIDSDSAVLKRFGEKLDRFPGDHLLLHNQFENHDFKNSKFDLILLSNFLNVVPVEKIDESLNKATNLLNLEGLLYLKVNTLNSRFIQEAKSCPSAKEVSLNKFIDIETNFSHNYFSENEIFQLVEKHNLQFITSSLNEQYYVQEEGRLSEQIYIFIKDGDNE